MAIELHHLNTHGMMEQAVNICTIRGIKFCPMCGRNLKEADHGDN